MTTDPKRILVMEDLEYAFGRRVFAGICVYARPTKPWRIRRCRPRESDFKTLIELWKPDGIITHTYQAESVDQLLQSGVPVINIGESCPTPFPSVMIDDAGVGTIAADHFLNLGLTNFGFFGRSNLPVSSERERGFTHRLTAKGHSVSVVDEYLPPKAGETPETPWDRTDRHLRAWLLQREAPCGVLAATDAMALRLSELCLDLGLRVPEQIALLGVDNDDSLCPSAYPPLSSVDVPARRIGFEAAALLDILLHNPKAKVPALTRLHPDQVVARQSTDLLAVTDPEIAKALHYIRMNADRPLQVSDILDVVPLSRRSFERRFFKNIGRSPLDEIHRVRVEHARALLRETSLPMSEVAERAGFGDGKQFSTLFKLKTGYTPTAYRRANNIPFSSPAPEE